MLNTQNAQELIGRTVYGSDGDKIGEVGQVYLGDHSGQPEFITVRTGFFGSNESFVPVAQAQDRGQDVAVPYTKDKVKDAPNIDNDGHISEQQELEIFQYYGLGDSGPAPSAVTGDHPGAASDQVGHDTSGPTTDEAMTRSEERLNVGTQSQEVGRARLRKWVETEDVSVTVPVTREKAVLEREPVRDDNLDEALDGPAISEEEHEVVLNEERPVVEKTTEPVERVRLSKAAVTDEETVTDQVRKEHVEVEGDTDGR